MMVDQAVWTTTIYHVYHVPGIMPVSGYNYAQYKFVLLPDLVELQ